MQNLRRQQKTVWFFLVVLLTTGAVKAELQCVKLSQVPARYHTVQHFKPEPIEELKIIPPVFRTVTEKLLVVEAHCPGDQLVSETIMIEVRPAYTDLQVVPAVYETVYIKKQIKPPSEGWRLTAENRIRYEKRSERFEVMEIRRVKLPEQTREVSVPAKHETIRVSRVRQPARQCEAAARIPARFRSIQKKLLDKPAEVRRVSIPAQFETITKQLMDKESSIKANPVACGTPGALPKSAAELPEKPSGSASYFFINEPDDEWEAAGFDPAENKVWIRDPETMAMAAAEQGRLLAPLPWPPPRGSWLFPIPRLPFDNAAVMTDVEAILAPALREAGYINQRYYRIDNPDGSRNGFAIVTQLEKWVGNGAPDEDKRFVRAGQEKFSLVNYIRELFFAPEGTYRLILLLITDKTWTWDDDPDRQMTEAMAGEWLFGGASNLPEEYQTIAFTNRHRVEVVIYEFKRVGETVTLELPGGLTTAENHFRHSGIQSRLGLNEP